MLLSDLLGAPVSLEGHQVGHVIDVRLIADDLGTDQPMPRLRIYGMIVSPHAKMSTLGYERSGLRSPWPIAAFQHWRHRGSFLVRWPDIEAVRGTGIELRPGHRRYSARLTNSAVHAPDFDERQH